VAIVEKLRLFRSADQPAREGPRYQAPLLIELAKLRYRLLNDSTPNTNATNKTPVTVGLSVLLANRMAQIHAPSEQIVRSRKYPRSSLQPQIGLSRHLTD